MTLRPWPRERAAAALPASARTAVSPDGHYAYVRHQTAGCTRPRKSTQCAAGAGTANCSSATPSAPARTAPANPRRLGPP
jgi:hypothetical protein